MPIDSVTKIDNETDLLKAIEEAINKGSLLIVNDDVSKDQIKELSEYRVKVLTLLEVFIMGCVNPADLSTENAVLLTGHVRDDDDPVITLPVTIKVDKKDNKVNDSVLKTRVLSQLQDDLKQAIRGGDIYVKDNQVLTKKVFRDLSEYLQILGATVDNKTFYLKARVAEIVKNFRSITLLTPSMPRVQKKGRFACVQPFAASLEVNRWRLTDILTQRKQERENGKLTSLSIFYEKDESLDMLRMLSRDWIKIKHYKELINDKSDVRVFIEPPCSAQTLSYYLMLSKEQDHAIWVLPDDEKDTAYKKSFTSGESGEKLIYRVVDAIRKKQQSESKEKSKLHHVINGRENLITYQALFSREFSEKTDIITAALGNN